MIGAYSKAEAARPFHIFAFARGIQPGCESNRAGRQVAVESAGRRTDRQCGLSTSPAKRDHKAKARRDPHGHRNHRERQMRELLGKFDCPRGIHLRYLRRGDFVNKNQSNQHGQQRRAANSKEELARRGRRRHPPESVIGSSVEFPANDPLAQPLDGVTATTGMDIQVARQSWVQKLGNRRRPAYPRPAIDVFPRNPNRQTRRIGRFDVRQSDATCANKRAHDPIIAATRSASQL